MLPPSVRLTRLSIWKIALVPGISSLLYRKPMREELSTTHSSTGSALRRVAAVVDRDALGGDVDPSVDLKAVRYLAMAGAAKRRRWRPLESCVSFSLPLLVHLACPTLRLRRRDFNSQTGTVSSAQQESNMMAAHEEANDV